MSMVAFDTHNFVKNLTKAGMPEPQAEVLAKEQSRLIENELATKRDIEELRAATKRDIEELRAATKRDIEELKAATKRDIAEVKQDIETLRAEVKRDIAETKTDILKWMISAMLGQTAIIVALVKLL